MEQSRSAFCVALCWLHGAPTPIPTLNPTPSPLQVHLLCDYMKSNFLGILCAALLLREAWLTQLDRYAYVPSLTLVILRDNTTLLWSLHKKPAIPVPAGVQPTGGQTVGGGDYGLQPGVRQGLRLCTVPAAGQLHWRRPLQHLHIPSCGHEPHQHPPWRMTAVVNTRDPRSMLCCLLRVASSVADQS